jgi:hypothetical protein
VRRGAIDVAASPSLPFPNSSDPGGRPHDDFGHPNEQIFGNWPDMSAVQAVGSIVTYHGQIKDQMTERVELDGSSYRWRRVQSYRQQTSDAHEDSNVPVPAAYLPRAENREGPSPYEPSAAETTTSTTTIRRLVARSKAIGSPVPPQQSPVSRSSSRGGSEKDP